jgi:hypothetical protein
MRRWNGGRDPEQVEAEPLALGLEILGKLDDRISFLHYVVYCTKAKSDRLLASRLA